MGELFIFVFTSQPGRGLISEVHNAELRRPGTHVPEVGGKVALKFNRTTCKDIPVVAILFFSLQGDPFRQ